MWACIWYLYLLSVLPAADDRQLKQSSVLMHGTVRKTHVSHLKENIPDYIFAVF